MPACARKEIVRDGEVGVYHVYNRCVRRAFLCGQDERTGKDYEYRRLWICQMERKLAGLFGVDIGWHAELSNHLHLIVRTRPDVVDTWSDEEVARRSLTINRLIHSTDGETIRQVTDKDIQVELAKPDRASQLRKRLSSVSFFMKALCEHIARRANKEEGLSGNFFEDRFKSQCLANEASIVVCGIYVDLNQIRAGEALVPEESTHTSAYDRIQAERERQKLSLPLNVEAAMFSDSWLCELSLDERAEAYEGAQPSKTGCRASDKGILPMKLEEYLELLDWTGRSLAKGKKGAIPEHLAPILDRLGINQFKWLDLVSRFDSLFSHVIGTAAQLTERAAQAERHWYHGRAACEEAFG